MRVPALLVNRLELLEDNYSRIDLSLMAAHLTPCETILVITSVRRCFNILKRIIFLTPNQIFDKSIHSNVGGGIQSAVGT